MNPELVLDVLTGLFLVSGAAFVAIGGIGLIRLPDFFSRTHGGGITDTMGAGLVLIGLMFQSGISLVTIKLAIILFFLLVTSPTSCHALSKAALAEGLVPEVIEKSPRDEDDEGRNAPPEDPPSTQ
ncbi:MAG: monovalent cation/H(+) antiporter subunit G [Acidobacteriota bacterium]